MVLTEEIALHTVISTIVPGQPPVIVRGARISLAKSMRDAFAELADEWSKIAVEEIKDTAERSRHRFGRRRRPRGRGWRAPRGGWPVDSGRSFAAFRPAGGRAKSGEGAFILVENTTPYARAVERGAPPTPKQPRRPAGKHIRRTYFRRLRPKGIDLVEEIFPGTVEAAARRARRRAGVGL